MSSPCRLIDGHLEQQLLAYVTVETANWLKRIVPEETNRHVMMSAMNFVKCIASVPIPIPTPSAHRRGDLAAMAPRLAVATAQTRPWPK
jgi:hypothetical protein